MWIAIFITVVASTGNNIGKTLQKSATASLPRLTLESVVLYRYLSSKEWILGLAADLGGGLLMIAAVARAPVGFSCVRTCQLYRSTLATSSTFCCVGIRCSARLWTWTCLAGCVLPLLPESMCSHLPC